MVAYST